MAEGSMGDRLLNKLVERAQLWAEVKDDDSVQDGKVVMRKRKSYLEARKEAFDYVVALERTVRELEEKLDSKKLSVPEYVRQMTIGELGQLGLMTEETHEIKTAELRRRIKRMEDELENDH